MGVPPEHLEDDRRYSRGVSMCISWDRVNLVTLVNFPQVNRRERSTAGTQPS